MKEIIFDPIDFINNKYFNCSIEYLAAEECKVHNIIHGIFAICSNYSTYISTVLPIMCQLDKLKGLKNKEVFEKLRKAFLLDTVNTITDTSNLEEEHPTVYRMMTITYEFDNDEETFTTIPAVSCKLSLKYIKNGFDDLLMHIRNMVEYRNVSIWKKYFPDIESDLHRIYNEINCYELGFSNSVMGTKAVEKISYIREHGTRLDKIKIKSITDIAKYSYEIIETLNEFYKIIVETDYQMMTNVSISDPTAFVKTCGGIEDVHKIVEEAVDIADPTEEIEDFIDTDE